MESSFYSKFKKSKIFKAVTLSESPIFKFRKLEKRVFLLLFFFFLIFFFIGNFPNTFFGLSLLSFDFFLIAFLKDLFFEQKIKNPKPEGEIFDKIDFEVAKAIYNALKFSKTQKVNSSIFLYFSLG
jgi:energy-coupling factor transporter transmembrane protein EcfT